MKNGLRLLGVNPDGWKMLKKWSTICVRQKHMLKKWSSICGAKNTWYKNGLRNLCVLGVVSGLGHLIGPSWGRQG
jgi:hypothetical protein